MNWEAIGAVGELLSAVVVVASVIYLGVQVRASIRLTEGNWHPDGDDNCVCTCRIQDLPRNLPVYSRIEVEVTYGKDGLLEVLARHRESGKTASACVNFVSGSDDLKILGGGDADP